MEEYKSNVEKYNQMPNGVYSGFKTDDESCPENGIIALLGYPGKPANTHNHAYQSYDLIYINQDGKTVLGNQKEILDALTVHKDQIRFIPSEIDKGDPHAIQNLVGSFQKWLKNQAVEEEKQDDGTAKKKMGSEAKDIISKVKTGDRGALQRIRQNIKVTDKYQSENFDLITWLLVSL